MAKSDGPSTHKSSKKTNPKKRELEQELRRDVPAKQVKTDGSKKLRREITKGPGDDHPEAVGVSNLPKSKKSSKSSEASKPLKSEDKKRKHVDEQEMAAETSRPTKRMKTDSTTPK
jgi:hypothetical protein